MIIMARIFLGLIIIVLVTASFFELGNISFSNFLIIMALCWGFIGTIETIEKNEKK